MEDDVKDDHNHNYCGSGSGKVQMSDVTTVPPPPARPAAVSAGEPKSRQGRLWSGGSVGSRFPDSDTGSESSEVSEADLTLTAAANNAEGKFCLGSTSKFRKFTNRT